MGILNVGADSFSDGGMYSSVSAAVARAGEMLAQGADIIDIGAESTRPSARALGLEDELAALLPKLKAVRENFPSAPISVDTYKPEVARAAVEAGADIVNDVYALRAPDGRYPAARAAADMGAPLVVAHCCRGETFSGGFFEFFMEGMKARLDCALAESLPACQIVADVGVGFGKTEEQNYELVRRLPEVGALGFPLLLGVSRKSMFASVAGESFALRDFATAAVSVFAALSRSCAILRVHDVAANLAAIKTALKLV